MHMHHSLSILPLAERPPFILFFSRSKEFIRNALHQLDVERLVKIAAIRLNYFWRFGR
jgi:hypothetical protein